MLDSLGVNQRFLVCAYSGAGQDWRIDRAGGETKGLACQPLPKLFSARGFNWCKTCAMIQMPVFLPVTQQL